MRHDYTKPKKCTRCGEIYDNPQKNFYPDRTQTLKSGETVTYLRSECKVCSCNKMAIRYQKHKPKNGGEVLSRRRKRNEADKRNGRNQRLERLKRALKGWK